jgi:hypothetical protein
MITLSKAQYNSLVVFLDNLHKYNITFTDQYVTLSHPVMGLGEVRANVFDKDGNLLVYKYFAEDE